MAAISRATLKDRKRQQALDAYMLAVSDPNLPHDVLEDGCFMRSYAALLRIRNELDIPEKNLGTIFYINPGIDPLAQLTAINPSDPAKLDEMKRFLLAYEAVTGSDSFRCGGHDFRIGREGMPIWLEYGLGQTQFSDSELIIWKTGHVAPVVNGYVIDPPHGIRSAHEWIKDTGFAGGLAFIAQPGEKPQLVAKLLSKDILSLVARTMENELGLQIGDLSAAKIQRIWNGLSEEKKAGCINRIMEGSIKAGRIGLYEQWTDFWVRGASTFFPGVDFHQDAFSAMKHDDIVNMMHRSLEPFMLYQRIRQVGPEALLSDASFRAHNSAFTNNGFSDGVVTSPPPEAWNRRIAEIPGAQQCADILAARYGDEIIQSAGRQIT